MTTKLPFLPRTAIFKRRGGSILDDQGGSLLDDHFHSSVIQDNEPPPGEQTTVTVIANRQRIVNV